MIFSSNVLSLLFLVALQSLVLNQCSWLLKMAAIEIQASTSQRTYLARLLSNLFSIGEHAAVPEDDAMRTGRSTSGKLFILFFLPRCL